MAGFFVENFGCRATQADGAAIEQAFAQRGIERAADPYNAQVIVLNSCTVTAAADVDLRSTVRRIHRENPTGKILVTGCYAQRAPNEVASLPGVTWVVDNSQKHRVAEIAYHVIEDLPDRPAIRASGATNSFVPIRDVWAQMTKGAEIYSGDIFAHTELLGAPVFNDAQNGWKTRPNLKVQDGCDNRCSFCVIPFVRGKSRSLKLDEILREIDDLVAAGYREVVISGINLGRWGRDLAVPSLFEELVRAILERTSLERLRISSVEPMDWSPELIELVAGAPRICKHAHVPLQSGSDRVLRAMHRKYRPWHYADKVRRIREAMPDAAIGADVMAGFPGETDELFEENREFIASLPFTYLHVFTYSPRPGTMAANMAGHIPIHVARERNRILRELVEGKNLEFRKRFVGRTIEAITLQTSDECSTEALTNNFLKLEIAGTHPANSLAQVEITGLTAKGLSGNIDDLCLA